MDILEKESKRGEMYNVVAILIDNYALLRSVFFHYSEVKKDSTVYVVGLSLPAFPFLSLSVRLSVSLSFLSLYLSLACLLAFFAFFAFLLFPCFPSLFVPFLCLLCLN